MRLALALYVAGALVALVKVGGGWRVRLGLAILWPLGPLAGLVTVTAMLALALVAFPLFGAIVAAAAVTAYFFL